jgi:predicted extracellular nuclease
VIAIGAVQGPGAASPRQGQQVSVRGIVVGDFQQGGFSGFYLQDNGDSDAATSDGLFIYAPGASAVSLGDLVSVTGTVSEYFGMTEVTASSLEVCASDRPLPAPSALTLPRDEAVFEAHEGMRVSFAQPLSINEYYNFGRYGEIVLGSERHHQPTARHAPGSAEAVALAAANSADRITLDDGRSNQNPDPARHPNGAAFGLDNRFRGGDLVTDLVGVLDYRFDLWRLQPTQNAHVTAQNPRPAPPEVGGTLRVSSFNVLNYFTTLGSRGADTAQEFERQEAKIVDALATIDADVFGLIEIENNGTALTTLVAALNALLGDDVYAAIETGPVGTDEITTALVYKPATVEPVGSFAVLTSTVDPDFDTMRNRPALAQTFRDLATGAKLTVVVNHLKSKGSSCADVGDPEDPFGQGNCNGVRTLAAEALARWMATDPTGQAPGRSLLIGDFNAYDHEDPVLALEAAGFTDLEKQFGGEAAYSYVFDGQLGYLDYAFASEGLLSEVTGAASWHINADEPSLLDYDMTFKAPAQDAIYAPDAFRSSDHDPVIIGLELVPPLPAWSATQVYTAGRMVSFQGSSWRASWWTRNQRPGDPYGPWQEIAVAPDGTSLWTPSRIFVAGEVVLYEAQKYMAKWWTRNQAPGNPWGPWALR